MIERWSFNDCDVLMDGRAFAAMDPGDAGAVLIYTEAHEPPVIVPTATNPLEIASAMIASNCRTMLVERQFVKFNVNSAIELAWRTGIVIGATVQLIQRYSGDATNVDMVELMPSTWQGAQKLRMGLKGTKMDRAAGIKMAIQEADGGLQGQTHWETASRPIKEGIASAYGIAQWWLGKGQG